MSQHSKSTHSGPSRVRVTLGWALTALGSAGTGYVISTPGLSGGREMVAGLLGVSLTGWLTAHSMGLAVARVVARDRALDADEMRQAEQRRRDRARELDTAAWSIGEGSEPNGPWGRVEHPYHDSAPMTPPMYADSEVTHLMPAYRDEEPDPDGCSQDRPSYLAKVQVPVLARYPDQPTFPGFAPIRSVPDQG